MVKVLIADKSPTLVNILISGLSDKHEIKASTTIAETEQTLRSYLPDILIIDADFMTRDIIHALNSQSTDGNIPRIITLTHQVSLDILNCLTCNTIDFIISKPFNLDFIIKSIGDIAQRIENPEHSDAATPLEINDILMDLGFSTAHKTYRLLSNAVLYRYDRPDCAMKELYIDISHRCQTTPENVEKGIRDSIRRAYITGDPEIWSRYIGSTKENEKPFKGNSDFISKVIEYIKRQKHISYRAE